MEPAHTEPGDQASTEAAVFRAVARDSRRRPAAVIVVAIAVLGVALLTKEPAPTVILPTTSVAPTGSLGIAVTSSPATTPEPTSQPTPGLPSLDPNARPFPSPYAVPLPASTIDMRVTTPLTVARENRVPVTFVLPDGWAEASDTTYTKVGGEPPNGVSFGIWSLENVFASPCRWSTHLYADDALMRSTAALAGALSQLGRSPGDPPTSDSVLAPLGSKPRQVTIAGLGAWYVEVLTGPEFDFTACDGGQLVFWRAPTGVVRYGLGQGELQRLWVLDAGDGLLVIDAASYDGTSTADQAELQAVVDSVVIRP